MGRIGNKIKEILIVISCILVGALGGYLANVLSKENKGTVEYVEYPSITDQAMPGPIYDSIYNCDHLLRLGYDLRDSLDLIINDPGAIARLTDIYLSSFMDESAILSQKPYHIRRVNTIWDVQGNAKENKIHLMLSGKTGAVLNLKQNSK